MSIVLNFSETVNHGKDTFQFGQICDRGFTNEDIIKMFNVIANRDNVELHNIKTILPQSIYDIDEAYVLIMKNYFQREATELLQILTTDNSIQWDTHRIKNGSFVENTLGYKLVFASLDVHKVPFSLEENRGTVYNINSIESLKDLHFTLQMTLGGPLFVEATYLHSQNCTYHQTKDRKKVILMCIGESLRLNFCWYHLSQKVSDVYTIILKHGEMAILSEYAAGLIKNISSRVYLKYSICT